MEGHPPVRWTRSRWHRKLHVCARPLQAQSQGHHSVKETGLGRGSAPWQAWEEEALLNRPAKRKHSSTGLQRGSTPQQALKEEALLNRPGKRKHSSTCPERGSTPEQACKEEALLNRPAKRQHSTIFLERMRKGHRQSDKRWNRFKGNTGETSAHMGFSQHTDAILNWTELCVRARKRSDHKDVTHQTLAASLHPRVICSVTNIILLYKQATDQML